MWGRGKFPEMIKPDILLLRDREGAKQEIFSYLQGPCTGRSIGLKTLALSTLSGKVLTLQLQHLYHLHLSCLQEDHHPSQMIHGNC